MGIVPVSLIARDKVFFQALNYDTSTKVTSLLPWSIVSHITHANRLDATSQQDLNFTVTSELHTRNSHTRCLIRFKWVQSFSYSFTTLQEPMSEAALYMS